MLAFLIDILNNIDDISLIKDCLKGSQLAYKELYTRYKGYCYTICLRYGVQKEEIKDHLQVIFSETFRNLKKYDGKKVSFKTWSLVFVSIRC